MKTLITLALLLLFALAACTPARKKVKRGATSDLSALLLDTTVVAAQDLCRENGRQLLIVITDEKGSPEDILQSLGYSHDRLDQWAKSYRFLLLQEQTPEAAVLMQEYYIRHLPATVLFTSSDERPGRVRYGFLIPGGDITPGMTELSQRLYDDFQQGDRDPRLLSQLLDHLSYLLLEGAPAMDARRAVTDAYLQHFSDEELLSREHYQELKGLCRDTRLAFIDRLLNKRDWFNEAFRQLAREEGFNNPIDADWMIRQAIRKTLEKAVELRDETRYDHALATRDRWQPGYLDEWMAESIFRFQLRGGTPQTQRTAALAYFEQTDYYYSRQYDLLEAGARIIRDVSEEPAEWAAAERWIARVITQKANPTRYRLQADLCEKLGKTDQLAGILDKIEDYRETFREFVALYPEKTSVSLASGNISKAEYDRLAGIPTGFREFTYYISRESSLFKSGEKIEAVALIQRDAEEVELLSRVHLETSSILPVRHFRSYYIRSRFSREGEHLASTYEQS